MSYPGEPPPQDPADPNAPQQPQQPPPAPPGYSQPQYPPQQYPPQQYPPQQYPPQGYYPPQQYAVQPPNHGTALAAMIVGIVSLVLACGYGIGLFGSPVAWYLGAKAKKEIDASGGQLGGRGMAQAGFIMGIVGTILLVLVVLIVVAIIIFAVGTGSTSP